MAKGIACLGILFSATLAIVDAEAVTVEDLLITEIMADPAAVSDARGEWFELFNPGSEAIDLRDLTIGDDGSDLHRIETDLLILPGQTLTLARNGNSSTNGGFQADYVYENFVLGNSSDEIVLRNNIGEEYLRLDYTSGFVLPGRSRMLAGLPMSALSYVLAPEDAIYGLGDLGTPGFAEGFGPVPAAVPVPAAAWLFASAIGMLAFAGTRSTGREITSPEGGQA